MDSKYYTPTIDEFYPGFEYEHSCGSVRFAMLDLSGKEKTVEGEPTKIWIKHIFSGNEFDIWKAAFDFESALKDGQIRVKSLDKEDLESLGYYNREESINSWYFSNLCSIHIDEGYNYLSIYDTLDEKRLFSGYIKNKSELIKLLIQLGIYART